VTEGSEMGDSMAIVRSAVAAQPAKAERVDVSGLFVGMKEYGGGKGRGCRF
jgi:hypothetical protein